MPIYDVNGMKGQYGRNLKKERYDELRYKQSVMGPTRKYKRGDDITNWLTHITFAVEYYGYDGKDARIFLYNNFEDLNKKQAVADIMRENGDCSFDELLTQIAIQLGAKSRSIVMAESRKMRREDGEPVQDFHIRVKNIITRKMMTDPMGKYLLDSSIFHQECLDVFYRGLRSRALAKEAMDKGAQTVKEALIHISNFV